MRKKLKNVEFTYWRKQTRTSYIGDNGILLSLQVKDGYSEVLLTKREALALWKFLEKVFGNKMLKKLKKKYKTGVYQFGK